MRRSLLLGLLLLVVPPIVRADPAPADPDGGTVARKKTEPTYAISPSPILGYDPTVGTMVGAALFVRPDIDLGWFGATQVEWAPRTDDLQSSLAVGYRHVWGAMSPSFAASFDGFPGIWYGAGNDTSADDELSLRTRRVEVTPALAFTLGDGLELETSFRWARLETGEALRGEGEVDGSYAGGRVELVADTRDAPFAPSTGMRASVWTEGWGLQAGARSPRFRAGAAVARFVPLYGRNWVLALRLAGGVSAGDRAYLTQFDLGGAWRLRGFLSNRFRGDHEVDGSAELRFPIWRALSGVAFADVGRVWLQGDGAGTGPMLHPSGGAGLRIGLPPDRQTRLRFDVGFAPDQSGLFFTFGEAF